MTQASKNKELDVVCNQIAWLERYLCELSLLLPPGLSGSTESLANSTVPHFFYMVRSLLIDSIYLGVGRLLDPEQQGSGKRPRKNMTIECLINSLTCPKTPRYDKANCRLQKCRTLFGAGRNARNTTIAHLDYSTVCSSDPSTLAALGASYDTLSDIVFECQRIIEEIADPNPLPTVSPKNDKRWRGIAALLDHLRDTKKDVAWQLTGE